MGNITLRDYQQECVDTTIDFLKTKAGNPLLALPTGAGKGWIQAFICKFIQQNWPDRRVVMAVHNQELVRDTYERAKSVLGDDAVGVNCAGVSSKRDWDKRFIFGSVQSMAGKAELLGWRDLLLVDEAHRVGNLDTANYGQLYGKLAHHNSRLRVAGLTATPWRVGMGLLTNGPVFDEVVYDVTGIEGMNMMFERGYLVRPITFRGDAHADTAMLKRSSNGDFTKASMEAAVSDKITRKALVEFTQKAFDRHAWLVFAISIEHGEKCVAILNEMGIPSGLIHSKMKAAEKKQVLDLYRSGAIRCVVNVDMLTTGFDYPKIDALAILRPTMSSSLWVQMVGRGLRICLETGKVNCLVLDFASNIERCGPINNPIIPLSPAEKAEAKRKEKEGEPAEPMPEARICDACGMYNEADALVCECCETPLTKFTGEASDKAILASAGGDTVKGPQKGRYDVVRRTFKVQYDYNGNSYLQIVYAVEGGMNFVKKLSWHNANPQATYTPGAYAWWSKNSNGQLPPDSAEDAIERTDELMDVVAVRVKQDDKGNWKVTKEYHHEDN